MGFRVENEIIEVSKMFLIENMLEFWFWLSKNSKPNFLVDDTSFT
jgi:hypothetical protein